MKKLFLLILITLNLNSFSLNHSKIEYDKHWINIQKKAEKCVVRIKAYINEFNWLEPYKGPNDSEKGGSGFFIDNAGHILTNHHVIKNAYSIKINIPFLGDNLFDVDIVGIYPEQDIALLKLKPFSKDFIEKNLGKIEYLSLGDSNKVNSAETVLALGYPFDFENLISSLGIVSSTTSGGYIQITAPINYGNSGGPLLNSNGNVIGVNSLLTNNAQNTNFSIPINKVKKNLNLLKKQKILLCPFFGCHLSKTDNNFIKYFNIQNSGGAYVSHIYKGSISEKIGIEHGDTIHSINGNIVDNYTKVWIPELPGPVSFNDYLDRLTIGQEIQLLIYRQDEKIVLNFRFKDELPPAIHKVYTEIQSKKLNNYEVFGGLVIMPLTLNHVELLLQENDYLSNYLNPENCFEPALIITHIFQNSPADSSYIYRGLVMDKINGIEVKTLENLYPIFSEITKDSLLTIETKNGSFYVLSIQEILGEENYLSNKYKYNKSKLFDQIKN